jgi:zinc protease
MTGTDLLESLSPTEHRLANGLTLLVHAHHASPVVALVTHVRTGYFDEPDHLVGVSHVLEHMYFKGTARRAAGEIAQATKAAGGYLNAGTIYDRTSYYSVLPASAVDEGLDIQADALINSTIDEEELRKELVVIIEEVKRKLDTPSAMASEKLYEAMFEVHPIRRWRMGMPDALRALTRADVWQYYRSMYTASNIILVVAGAVDPDRVVRRVEELYVGIPSGVVDRGQRPEPARAGARLREMSGDIARTYGQLGWRTPGSLHPHTPALDALATVAGQGRASRLYRGVRERGLASSIHAYNYTPTEIGVFGVGLECEPGAATDALRASWSELDRLRSEPVAGHELDRVRTLMESRLLRRLETVEGRANLLAEWQALGDWRQLGGYLDRIRTLEPVDLTDAASRYLDPGAVTALVYRPAGTPPIGWDDSDVPTALSVPASAPSDDPVAASAPGETARSAARAAERAPAVLVGAPDLEDGVVQYPLEGGGLVVKRRAHAPLVSLAVVRAGGALRERPATAGITDLMVRATLKGTASRTAERIAMESEGMGGSIGASAGADLSSWTLTVPSTHFRAALSLLTDVALHPAFPDAAVETEQRMALAALDRLRDDMYGYPLRLLLKAAFGDHPYGLGVEDETQALASVTPDDVRRWHGRELGEAWIFVVGDIEPNAAADAVGALVPAAAPGAAPDPAPPVWPDRSRRQEVKRDKAQTALAIAFPGPPRSHPDRVPLEILSAAVSGLGNRLFEELRSRRSLAYTVSAYPLLRRQAGAFVGYIATSPDREEEARAALLDEIARLRVEPPTDEELERARRYAIGAWQIRSQTNTAQLSDLAAAIMMGEGVEEIRDHAARIEAVDRDTLLAVAHRWFDADRLAEGMVRGVAEALASD